MTGQTITIKGEDGDFAGYLASPGPGRGPGIVVIQEIFGVNQVMRDIADGMASRGYFALVPDLFWRLEPNVQLTDKTDAEWKKALRPDEPLRRGQGRRRISRPPSTSARAAGLHRQGGRGRLLPGRAARLSHRGAHRHATPRSAITASISRTSWTRPTNIKNPLMLHIAEATNMCRPPAQAKIEAGLKNNPHVTIHRYPQMNHAFARVGGKHYDKANGGPRQ